MRTIIVTILAAATLAGCATYRAPETPQERAEADAQLRLLHPVLVSLAKANVGLCSYLAPDPCGAVVEVGPGEGLVAMVDDEKRIRLNLDTARLLRDDDQRASILAHELAHLLVHFRRGDRGMAFHVSPSTEIEADCVGAMLAARAGYNPRAGATVLRQTPWFAYAEVAPRAARIEAVARQIAMLSRIDHEAIRQICGVVPRDRTSPTFAGDTAWPGAPGNDVLDAVEALLANPDDGDALKAADMLTPLAQDGDPRAMVVLALLRAADCGRAWADAKEAFWAAPSWRSINHRSRARGWVVAFANKRLAAICPGDRIDY